MTIDERRAKVVEIAVTWLRTPYFSGGENKGIGVDCAKLPAAVFAEAGEIEHPDIPFYPDDWYLHTSDERYLAWVEIYANPIGSSMPLPGDLSLFRWGGGTKQRPIAHSALVIKWPRVIHAWRKSNAVELADVGQEPLGSQYYAGTWRLKQWC